MTASVVICIGNPFRRDDGVASAVARHLHPSLPPTVSLVELDGEPARVIDAWAGADLALVVDAARTGAAAGTVRRVELATGGVSHDVIGPATLPASSHAASLGDAVELGRALGRMPARLVLYAVEGEDFTDGPGLSQRVASAVPEVAARVIVDVVVSTDVPARPSGGG